MMSAATEEIAKFAAIDGGPGPAYVMRLATVYLVVSHDTRETVEYGTRFVSALEKDPRVTHATVPPLDPGWSPQYTAYLPINENGIGGVLA